MKLRSACCGGILLGMPVVLVGAASKHDKKMYYDYRPPGDYETQGKDCENALEHKTRYLQVEVFDYNLWPWIKATWTRTSGECGEDVFDEFTHTMLYDGPGKDGNVTGNRLQMDMYVCAPWGNYELEIEVKSTNGGNPMEKVAWEVEYGPDEYHIWDTLNTPFFGEPENFEHFAANGALPSEHPYAPIPDETKIKTGSAGITYKWPYKDSEAYYSLLYSGPFPPLDCPNLHTDIDYVGCYEADQLNDALNWVMMDEGPHGDATGSNNLADPAEPYRMFDGIGVDDAGVDAPGVMTLQKCAAMCEGHAFIGLQAGFKCLCGDEVEGCSMHNCWLEDDNSIPEYKNLCSGDSRVLCGTETRVSVYNIDGEFTPPDTCPTPTPEPFGFNFYGCSTDFKKNRVLKDKGPIQLTTNSPELCFEYCMGLDEGYIYFGMEYGEECFCGWTLSDSLALIDPNTSCQMECEGHVTEKCGGRYEISLYEVSFDTPAPTPAPVNAPGPGYGYDYLDCYHDDVENRIMGEFVESLSSMTPEHCFETCSRDSANKYFGTQYHSECFCGSEISPLDEHTLDEHTQLNVEPECTLLCSGDDNQWCGGSSAMTIYEFTDASSAAPTPSHSAAPTAVVEPGNGYISLGCHADHKKRRVMGAATTSEAMTTELCFERCKDEGYKYFGTQYGVECWCTNTLSLRHGESESCDVECPGDGEDKEMCGGSLAMSVYEITTDGSP